jgi:MFS transporter, DHA2 family, multidrug resistance protein
MTAAVELVGPHAPKVAPVSPAIPVRDRPWLAALAVVPILATVYQTLVLTDVTDDVIRKGIDAEHYSMIWTEVCWGISVLYGVFGGIWAMVRFGARDTLIVGLIWFALGNLLCGAAVDVPTLAVAKLVEGIGKGMVIVICRSLLYRQFDRVVIVAIGFYGVIAYATRPTTPLLTALVNDALSWRWVFWVNVPLALLAIPLVRRFVKPDRPAQPLPLRIDWIGVSLFTAWIVSLTFLFGWYRKWGGWTSNAFATIAVLALLLPIAVVAWVGAGLAVNEHLRRMFRVRIYVLAMCVRTLMLLQLLAVLTLMAKYCVALRDYPREVAGCILAPATLTMAVSTFLTTRFRERYLRHFWLLVGVAGCALCLWWMSSVDGFTSKGQVALMIGCWGLFVGLFPPAFLQDEVEGLDRRDFLYGGAVAVVFLIVPIVVVPTMTSTIVSAWTDRAADAQRMNLRENRPDVQESSARVADYYRQRGVSGPELSQLTSTVLGGFVKTEAVAHGIQSGLRFLSLIVGSAGLLVTALLAGTDAKRPS